MEAGYQCTARPFLTSELGFERCTYDQTLFRRTTALGITYISLYEDIFHYQGGSVVPTELFGSGVSMHCQPEYLIISQLAEVSVH